MCDTQTGIYLFTNTVNGKVYVGSGSLPDRKRDHLGRLRRGAHWNPHLQKAWDKYGAGAIPHDVLEYCPREDLIDREDWWMELLDSRDPERGYNLWSARRHEIRQDVRERLSQSHTGMTHTPEARARMSESHRGKSSGMLGKTHSPETKARMAAAQRGNQHAKGLTHTPEAKAKISAALVGNQRTKGKPWSDARRKAQSNKCPVEHAYPTQS